MSSEANGALEDTEESHSHGWCGKRQGEKQNSLRGQDWTGLDGTGRQHLWMELGMNCLDEQRKFVPGVESIPIEDSVAAADW